MVRDFDVSSGRNSISIAEASSGEIEIAIELRDNS
jgi:hypothetical protein